MNLPVSKRMTATALSLVLLSLAGCSAPDPAPSLPPPPPPESYYTGPANLAGGPAQAPPERYEQGLAGGPGAAREETAVISMAPIANPEDLPMAERHRIYGDRYDHLARDDAAEHRSSRPKRRASADRPPVATRPAAAPSHHARAAGTPAAKPAAPNAKAAAAPTLAPAEAKLQAAVAPQVSSGSTLTVSAPIGQRQPSAVALTLPQTLFGLIREQAAKVGLGRAARSAEVSATLSGQGYQITPNGAQTVKLKPGEAPVFQWQVTRSEGEPGPLSAKIAATLTGQRKPVTLPLATLEKAAPATGKGVSSSSGSDDIDIPGIGKVRAQTLLGGGLVLLALVLLIALARNADAAKEAARRRSDRLRDLKAPGEPAADTPAADETKADPGSDGQKL
jgi:hypothetical protein